MKEGVGCGQHGEDRILKYVFQNQDEGIVVDIGAADGFMNSNSAVLLRRPGWKGILVEPESIQFKKLHSMYEDRPGVVTFNCAIGLHEGEKEMHTCLQVSTFLDDIKKSAEDMHDVIFSTEHIHMQSLTTLLDKCKIIEEIDFLTIDVEGMNYEVWRSLNKEKYAPKLVCIEGKGYAMLGYREFCILGGNTFYLREDLYTI